MAQPGGGGQPLSRRTGRAATGRTRSAGTGSASVGSKAGVWSRRKSPCGGPRAGEIGGGVWNRQAEWRDYCTSGARPEEIPSNPNLEYSASGWSGYGDWLGSGRVHSKSFRTFRDARRFASSLGLEGLKDWHAYSKSGARPADIPSNPNRTYKGQGWDGWPDWLGVSR